MFCEDQITSWVEMETRFNRALNHLKEMRSKYEKVRTTCDKIVDEQANIIKIRIQDEKIKSDNLREKMIRAFTQGTNVEELAKSRRVASSGSNIEVDLE